MENKTENPFNISIESILNKEDGTLPFGYFEPSTDGKLTWNCGYDKGGDIISIFCYDHGDHKDKTPAKLPSISDAIFARDTLIKAGWLKMKPPEVTVKYADGESRPLNRKQKRYFARQMKKLSKENPFTEKTV